MNPGLSPWSSFDATERASLPRRDRWSRRPEGDASGGAGRDRTGDPLVANQVLSQLSYSPGLRWGPLDAATILSGGRQRQPPL